VKRSLRLVLGCLAISAVALAQAPLPPGAPTTVPPGHPPVQAAGQEPPADELPAGHPPVAPGGAPEPGGAPAPAGHAAAPRPGARTDTAVPSSELPVGVIEARIADAQGAPLPGTPVKLAILRQSVAEGDSKDSRTATTDAAGKARFQGLPAEVRTSFRVLVRQGAAEYASPSFSLREDMGHSVLLHVYPVTSDINRSMVGMRGFVMVQPRDDVFQFEVMFRVFNVGATTWVPEDLVLDLPRGWKGFNAQDSMGDTRFVAEGDRGARLAGTFGPGQQDVAFRFQVPNDHTESASFELSLPPHVAEMQVMAEAAKGMSIEVAGMSPARLTTGDDGRRLLVTGRQLKPGEPEMRELSLRFAGIPTPGDGRWYAAGIAAALALLGLSLAFRREEKTAVAALPEKDVARARKLLFDELVALEQARTRDAIGPRTYEAARKALLLALTRLEAALPARREKAPRKPAPAR
jgi:hypothetical protein